MRLTSLALALATVLAGTAHAADTTQLVQGELPQVTAWRRDIHQHPELSNRETRTSALVAAQLKKTPLPRRRALSARCPRSP